MSTGGQMRRGPELVVAIVALVLVYVAGRLEFGALRLSDVSLLDLGELVAAFLFVALLIERATELVLAWRFGATEIAIRAPLKQAAERNATEMQMLARDMELLVSPQDRMALMDEGMRGSATTARQTLPAQAAETRRKLEALSLDKKSWAVGVSLTLAVGLSLSGFQLLHGAFAASVGLSNLPPVQNQVFSFVDIVLTAVVLAGGADGIHALFSRLTNIGGPTQQGIVPD